MSRKWTNTNSRYPQMPYDLIKEMLVALGIMGALVLLLSIVFSTPDVPALTAKQVAKQAPQLLLQNALDDLAGQDAISTYGPPYNNTKGAAQSIAGLSPQQWAGVQIPINSAQVNVIHPLTDIEPVNPSLKAPLIAWLTASQSQQNVWVQHVESALSKSKMVGNALVLPTQTPGDYGPLPVMLNAYLSLAQTGLLEDAIDGGTGPMPVIDRTKSLLLFQDAPDAAYASKLDMTGDEWGIIKETGNYPGAVWLWFYTLLYQIPPFSTSDSADLWVVLTTGLVTILLVLTPFIPGLRSIPRIVGIHKLIWRRYYRDQNRRRGART